MKVTFLLLLLSVTFSRVIRVQIESLCPDCFDFHTKSLQPFLDAQNSEVLGTVQIIFLGLATRHETSFSCQHKEPECLGNAVMALAKHYYDDEQQGYLKTNRFAVCFSDLWYRHHKDLPLSEIIEECDRDLVELVEAKLPELEFSLLDDEFKQRPAKLNHVPYFEIFEDGEVYHKDDDDEVMQYDLLGYLCRTVKEAKEVPICQSKQKTITE